MLMPNFVQEISNLTDYFNIVSDLRRKYIEEDGYSEKRLFFRGQENAHWDIRPSIFRDNMLSVENKLINEAKSRNPLIFPEEEAHFDRLTKLQHYGLATRLLDVTMNPLVALYFACQPYEDFVAEDECVPDDHDFMQIYGFKVVLPGVVYIGKNYPVSIDSNEAKFISFLSACDLEIEKSDFISHGISYQLIREQINTYDYQTQLDDAIKIINQSYFVMPNQNNERLIRQSGAFLLPGYVKFNRESNRISKIKHNLRSEFSEDSITVPFDKKTEILEELDFYNINGSTLFPELEHHMNYVKRRIQPFATSVEEL
jgi:hypothetical protein